MVPSTHAFVEYFRCPEHLAVFQTRGPLSDNPGYFRFGEAICYGRQGAGALSAHPKGSLVDVSASVSSLDGRVQLPFDLAEVVDDLRHERYSREAESGLTRLWASGVARTAYYFVRPVLPVSIRKHLQNLRLAGWQQIVFPRWPVDVTVETLMKHAMRLVLEQGGVREFPFIWFWPEGAQAALMVTHDVEGPAGARFSPQLMDLDDAVGVKSAFQLVPEAPHARGLLDRCRARGFEVNVHDLNHDGHLFRDKATFDARVLEINRYAREFGSRGFRSGAMYRRQDWFSAFEFSYDMSVPTVAHFEPQQGGCCTVMPYFIGDVLELPLTTTQDYALFNFLNEYSIDLWKTQIDLILASNGLVSFITHPDYLIETRARDVYAQLLQLVTRLRAERDVWVALPSEIDRWWRDRREMRLVRDGGSWRVEGPGSERARVAIARLRGEDLSFGIDGASRCA